MCWLMASCYTTSDIESNEIHTPMDAHINPKTMIVVMLCTSEWGGFSRVNFHVM